MHLKALCASPDSIRKGITKTLLIMKFTAIFLLCAGLMASATGNGQQITLTLKSATLEKAFEEIKKQSGYSFLYTDQMLQQAKRVDIDVKKQELAQVLQICFKDQPLDYTIVNKTIVVKAKTADKVNEQEPEAIPPPIDIRGRVLNENGEPVIITVTVKGTRNATSTNAEGYFELKGVDEHAILVLTGVSIETVEWKVGGKTQLDLIVKMAVKEGESVIINTGYGKVSKERFVGAYSQLDSAAYHRRAGMNILERLDGTVPGLLFRKTASVGQPIQIRGISTLGGGSDISSLWNPLIVVDNFPMDERFSLDNLNPNDIENITVLKDAAAASIWGARAGNGVIVVTTKKGRYNKALQTSVTSNITFISKPDLYYVDRVSTSDFIDIERSLFDLGFYNNNLNNTFTWPVVSPVAEILNRKRAGIISPADAESQINALRTPDLRAEIDQYVNRVAVRQQHHIGISGGSRNLGYNMSVGYNHNMSGIQGSKSDYQYTIQTNVSLKPIKNLEIQAGINYGKGINQSVPSFSLNNPFPYLQLKDQQGNYLGVPYNIRSYYLDTLGALNSGLLDWQYRPLDEIRNYDNTIQNQFVLLNASLTYRITPSLTADLSYRHTSEVSLGRQSFSEQSFYTRDLINKFTNFSASNPDLRYPVPRGSIVDLQAGEAQNYQARGSLGYSKNFQQSSFSIQAGGDISENRGLRRSNRLYGYNDNTASFKPNIDYYNFYPWAYATFAGAESTIPYVNGYDIQPLNRFVSVWANGSYTFKDRYTLYASARRDGTNVFGVNTNNKWKPLWSIGGKWQLSKESFFNISSFDQLSLRASFGYSGNVSNRQAGVLTINYINTPATYTNLLYATPGFPNNPELRWEQVQQMNIAADFSLFKGRLSGSLDLFRKISTDLISPYPFDPTTGVSQQTVNSASLKGSGFELSLQSVNIKGPVRWTTSAGVSYARTVVTEVYNGGLLAKDLLLTNVNASVGRLAFAMSSYRWAGLDPLTGDPLGYLNGQVSKDYIGISNDAIDNQKYHGSSVPLLSGFLQNSFSWKGATLSFNITGRFNYYFRKPALEISHTGQMSGTNYLAEYYDRWQKPGDEAFTNIPSILYPVPSAVANRRAFWGSAEIHVMRGDNIRLQDTRISYRWNVKQEQSRTFKSIDCFFYPNNLNLVIWRAAKTSYDPDYSGGSSDPTFAPTPRTWTFGITVQL